MKLTYLIRTSGLSLLTIFYFLELNEEEDESDEENDYDASEANTRGDANENETNEIELIQNIENRQVNKSNNSVVSSTPTKQLPTVSTRRATALAKQSVNNSTGNNQLPAAKKEMPMESTEASAAANIAASMKKRIVVIASTLKTESSVSTMH